MPNKPPSPEIPGQEAIKKIANNPSLLTGLALAVVGTLGFSGKAIIVKLAYRHGVDAVTLIMLRMLFALPVFMAMAWWASRGQARLARKDWVGVFLLGFSGYYLSSFLDFAGLVYIGASLERLILYLNPTIVMLALGFLLMIGAVLIADGFGVHVPKGYIYAAMAFSAVVEGLNMASRRARARAGTAK